MSIYSVDFGHGTGQDRGAEGYRNEEHDCREYGNLVVQKLRKLGHTVIDCTPSASPALNLGQSLAYRVNKANASGSVLHICMHVNAYKTDKASGCEVEYISSTGKKYADKIWPEIVNTLGVPEHGEGSVYRPNLYVLKYTKMASVLIEPFFCDNKADCNKYNAEKLATAIVKGITGKDTTVKTTAIAPKATTKTAPKYDTSIPTGSNILQVPGGYIESTTDGRMILHKDRGNYISIGQGFADIYWNNNKGNGGSKRISG